MPLQDTNVMEIREDKIVVATDQFVVQLVAFCFKRFTAGTCA